MGAKFWWQLLVEYVYRGVGMFVKVVADFWGNEDSGVMRHRSDVNFNGNLSGDLVVVVVISSVQHGKYCNSLSIARKETTRSRISSIFNLFLSLFWTDLRDPTARS